MNERTQELYAKACLDARDIHPTDVPAFIACMAEKFAELIVKECIEQIETCFAGGSVSMDDKPIWGPSVKTFKAWNWGLKCSRNHIKEVFGVNDERTN